MSAWPGQYRSVDRNNNCAVIPERFLRQVECNPPSCFVGDLLDAKLHESSFPQRDMAEEGGLGPWDYAHRCRATSHKSLSRG